MIPENKTYWKLLSRKVLNEQSSQKNANLKNRKNLFPPEKLIYACIYIYETNSISNFTGK